MNYYEISEETARTAHSMVHMSDYKPGSATDGYHDIFTSPVGLPGTAVATHFVNTPERKHYTLHIGPEDVAAFIHSGELNHQ